VIGCTDTYRGLAQYWRPETIREGDLLMRRRLTALFVLALPVLLLALSAAPGCPNCFA
jgi:hypothetical protein